MLINNLEIWIRSLRIGNGTENHTEQEGQIQVHLTVTWDFKEMYLGGVTEK